MGWRERERKREGLGQGGTREDKRQVLALGRERTTREEGGKEGSVKGRRSEGARMSGVWETHCPQKHQTSNPPSH